MPASLLRTSRSARVAPGICPALARESLAVACAVTVGKRSKPAPRSSALARS